MNLSYRLQAFVDAVVSYVQENAPDLMSKEFERDGVKIHATLMNSKFPVARAKDAAERDRKNWRRREESQQGGIPARQNFSATKIFKVHILLYIDVCPSQHVLAYLPFYNFHTKYI